MEDGLTIVSKMQKLMRDNLQKVGDILISGGVDNMEKYQYMLGQARTCLLYTSPSPRDGLLSRMPSSA